MIPGLVTPRLVLRGPDPDDFAPIAAFWASPRSVPEDGPLGTRAAWMDFAAAYGLWPIRGIGAWSVAERDSGAFVGIVGAFRPATYPETDLGWLVVAEAEGKGYAFEAARAARDWLFASGRVPTLVGYIAESNVRSIRLAERLGAVRDPDAAQPEGEPCLVFRHPAPAHEGDTPR